MGDSAPIYAAGQIQGARGRQEDSFGVLAAESLDPSEGVKLVLLLADGMGGHAGGSNASGLVVGTFERSFGNTRGPAVDRLRECLDRASDAVADAVDDSPALSGMGTTLVAAVVSDAGLEWISVGDSLLWLYRGGCLTRLNADHSMAPVFEHLVRVGEMSEEEAASDRRRHALRSAICGDEIALVDASSQPVELRRDDIVVLASDGIGSLDSETLAQSLAESWGRSLDESVSGILQSVDAAGKANQDNTTFMLCAPRGLTAEESPDGEEATEQLSGRKRRGSSRGARRPWAVAASLACLAVAVAVGVALPDQVGVQARTLFEAVIALVVDR